ncbi:MAG: DUF2066 domain-containing protein [Granulosicoccus sp.]
MKSAIAFANHCANLRGLLVLIVALLLNMATFSAHAQNDAFTIEVAVSERSEEEQQDAYMAGLRRVVLNNSGDKTVLNRDLIRQGLKRAEDYVQAFSYRRPPPGTVIASDTPVTRKVLQTGQATQLMLVSFDRQLVNQLISESAPARAAREQQQEPVPASDAFQATDSALVFLLIRDQGRDILVSDPVAANVQKRAREISGAAGITLVYPTGDDEDRQLMSVEEISAQTFNADNLASLSGRYAQDTILVGYLTRLGVRGWRGQWTRIDGEQQQQSQFDTSSLDEGLQQGLGVLSSVAQIDETYRYGGNAISDTEGLVWVGSLDSINDYARMMKFFDSIQAIGTVYPKEVKTTSMVFSVVPRSALVDIESALFDVSWLQRSALPLTNDPNSLARSADMAIEYSR